MATYPNRPLFRNGPLVSAIGFGAMGIGSVVYGSADQEEALRTLTYAADRGITFWDTADMYGTSQEVIGKWFAETGRRSEIFLCTKFGAMDLTPGIPDSTKPNSKPSYISRQVENSLKDLKTGWIDLYYQHRVDPEVPVEAVMEALRPYVESGKIKYIGLSENSIDHLKRAKAVPGVGEKVVVCQMEYSPFELGIEHNGFVAAARELGIGVVAYAPLGRGMMTGRFKSRHDFATTDIRHAWLPRFSDENFPKNLELLDKFREVAKKYDATASQVALAWILAEHPDFIPIPGSSSVSRLEENAKAAEITLAQEDVQILRAAVEAADVKGGRYPDNYKIAVDSVALSEWKGESA
ncbi:NADP-dependent oxidoreductase domain-containing protein [Fomitopsis serialis]|uniref:NADP-dependent oxidoreductase domain-containing protein n=1 Tax=Fomitopsis serialis TaxID=139415 RepID=UPI002008CEF8|nr:NADP-dependent oxidoreductase domain-containing protein [Neoantrodia serialis]KAH9921860.1 NADP-dependent oxidoreductase domain-containing protein [Neoantrodia serialis]